jgi:hypothetical protein
MATKKATVPKPEPTMQEVAANLKQRFIATASAHANEADVEQVMAEVIKDLNAAKRAVTLKMMGLDNRWGKWAIDHCNGRESPITQYLTAEHNELIKKWVQASIKEVLTTEFEKKLKEDIKKAFKAALFVSDYRVTEMVKDKAHGIVESILDAQAAELRTELDLGG